MLMAICLSFSKEVKSRLVLAPLVGVEDPGPAIAQQRQFQHLDAKAAVQAVGQLPAEHKAAVPVDDSSQVQKAPLHGNIGYSPDQVHISPLLMVT